MLVVNSSRGSLPHHNNPYVTVRPPPHTRFHRRAHLEKLKAFPEAQPRTPAVCLPAGQIES
jgi:hypothetical protein